MSKRLVMNCKKAALNLLVGVFSLGSIMTVTPLQAQTISTTNVKEEKIAVGNTTITLGTLCTIPQTGDPGINVTIERKDGFPEHTDVAVLTGKGSVTINGKKIDFIINGTPLKKVSDTKGTGIMFIDAANEEDLKLLQLSNLKGKQLTLSITSVEYEGAITPVSNELVELCKNVPVVTEVIPGEYQEEKDMGGLLPAKGLNIPMFDSEDDTLVDNIGFVGNKLQISVKGNDFCSVAFRNNTTGELAKAYPSTGGEEYTRRAYEIKDMNELSNYTPICDEDTILATDKGSSQISIIGK